MDSRIFKFAVYAQHHTSAGRLAHVDFDNEDDECMEDYQVFEGNREGLLEVAEAWSQSSDAYMKKVARVICEEVGQ